MPPAAPGLHAALTRIIRAERGRLLAALIAGLGNFDLAEEALADAVAAALIHWPRGMPDRPAGWLLRVARRKAIDRIRRQARWRDRVPDLEALAMADEADAAEPPPDIPDERLRLIFTCCHPALDPKSRIALTLRSLGGLSTAEIARAFLDTEPTMGQRLSRAKAKIAAAGIPFAVPGPELWEERFASVLAVIYLIFNEGYATTAGDNLIRTDLCDEAIYLGRMLLTLRADEAEAMGLLALMLITHARRAARVDGAGLMVPLAEQDRALWDSAAIEQGLSLLQQALAQADPGPYQIKAAIAACHVVGPTPDWAQIVLLYDTLARLEPTPVVRLNRAVAMAEAGQLQASLAALAALRETLAEYQPFHAAEAELLARAGAGVQACLAYDRAIQMCSNAAHRTWLSERKARFSNQIH